LLAGGDIPLPDKAIIHLKEYDVTSDSLVIKEGDTVHTGQKLHMSEDGDRYFISPVAGSVSGTSDYTGYYGRTVPTVSIDVAEEDQWDDEFENAEKTDMVETGRFYLKSLPGEPDFAALINSPHKLDTIIVYGMDQDLLVTTNQVILKNKTEQLAEGIAFLNKILSPGNMMIVVPPNLLSIAEKTGIPARPVQPAYPNALPRMIMKNLLGRTVPEGTRCEELGVGFINAEAVVALAEALSGGKMPVQKTLTVINRDYMPVHVRARVGTPVRQILGEMNIEVGHGDRLVFGGPMMGMTVYTEDMPILYDTDAIMIQDKARVVPSGDIPCVNCGECIRACPADIPVNMLVRLLENGLYEEAVSEYDLLSCIECGLCSYVCIARIPIFHHIMLGKYEFSRIQMAEESND